MLFPTTAFLVFFLVVFAVYWAIPQHRLRMVWLLAASCFFYMSWKPWAILLILFSASVDYALALQLPRTRRLWLRRTLLVGSVSANLGLLLFFKYANFFIDNAAAASSLAGLHYPLQRLDILLPLGISFYTFETISYMVDVYRGRIQPVRNPLDYALYIMFFPHLIAGPIVRPGDFLPQVRARKRFNWTRMQIGLRMILLGLFKKAVIADSIAPLIDAVFANPRNFDATSAGLAILGYSAQIYCDFSGYSDMALGLAQMLGFKLTRNFDLPYLSADIGEFWRRWHISLSSWLRDYVYIPLGGSRGGTFATLRNLMATMLVGGFWHGASWTFVFWGGYHGALLGLNRQLPRLRFLHTRPGRLLSIAATFVAVAIGWVFFRATTLREGLALLSRLVRPGGHPADANMRLTVIACLAVLALGHLLAAGIEWPRWERRLPAAALGLGLAAAAIAVFSLMPAERVTFIYFQF